VHAPHAHGPQASGRVRVPSTGYRCDLATLRALGFTRRQVRLAVLSQATGVVLVGLAVGIPLGLVVAILVVALVASGPGAVASARVRLAGALRTE
jgi:ABC-type antimicrobial peptide transport system permease subunit